uniref:Sugar phosphate transporter domain-containing protein n=1 Tax=Tetradesmus obliquus TaxID=3088 RepID=A0A383W5L6_TETOB|eukprot:jgi/Sobl393_1/19660/SZX72493.1
MRNDLAAAAALPQLPRWQYLVYFAGALAVQFTWGLTAVATRYVQTQAPLPVPTLQLWVVASAIAWVGLLLLYSIPSALQQQRLKQKAARQQAAAAASAAAASEEKPEQQHIRVLVSSRDDGTAAAAAEQALQPCGEQQQQQQQQQQQRQLLQRFKAAAKAAALSIMIGTLLNMSAVGSAGAAKLVNAYVVQLLLLLTPLVCALCNTLLLRQPSPPKLLLAVLLSLAGGGMVVGGYWLQEQQQQQQQTGAKAAASKQVKHLVLGVVIALLATLGQALYFVMVQLTRRCLTAQQVLWGNRNVAFVVVLPLALAAEGTSWAWVAALRPQHWAALAFIGICVQTLAAMGMQWTTRAIGAAAVSSVSSLRLVAAVVGSVVLLHETPTHPLVWSGFVVVVLTMGAYTAFQYKGQQTNQAGETAKTSQQAKPSGSSSSSNDQMPAAGDLVCHGSCSLQEEDRRSALVASVVASDALWQLFVPLVLLDRPRSASKRESGRSKSLPVFVHQQAAQRAGSGWDVDGQHSGQQQRRHVSKSEVGKVQRQGIGLNSPGSEG